MPNYWFKYQRTVFRNVFLVFSLLCLAGHPHKVGTIAPKGTCAPKAQNFKGYTFILPDIVNTRKAYAPFLLHYKNRYKNFYEYDIQKSENLREWNERFCKLCQEKDIEEIVYRSLNSQLNDLQEAAMNPEHRAAYTFGGNSFADAIVNMGCGEVVEYLYFAKKCEPFVTRDIGWKKFKADTTAARSTLNMGLSAFKQTQSHYIRMRYAYQIIRLAHYMGWYRETLLLYQKLTKQIDWRKESILFYWILGHQAGALQKLGRYPEAAYRYAQVFQHCPSKRIQAFRSFVLRNQNDWEEALKLCKNNKERATLHILRVGADPKKRHEDLRAIYNLNPKNELLDVLLIGELQEVEAVLLRNRYTKMRYGVQPSQKRIKAAFKHAQEMRGLIRGILEEGRIANPKLWEACDGYLATLTNDKLWAHHIFRKLKKSLRARKKDDAAILRQVNVWDQVARLKFIKLDNRDAENAVHAIQSMDLMEGISSFDPFFKDFVAEAYAAEGHLGKALTVAFDADELKYNPNMAAIQDMIEATLRPDQSAMDNAITTDSLQLTIADDLLQLEAAILLNEGALEAAYAEMKRLSPFRVNDETFTPFKETIKDCVHCAQPDSLTLTRRYVVKRMMEFDQKARAAEALDKPEAAYFHYLNGLAYYNMSYFGHAWKVSDRFRSGSTWSQLSKGPVYPHVSTAIGNRENLNLDLALKEFRETIRLSKNPEMAARGAFMAARCEQKNWFMSNKCTYKIGSPALPIFPSAYNQYTAYFLSNFKDTYFYDQVINECTWMGAYARRGY